MGEVRLLATTKSSPRRGEGALHCQILPWERCGISNYHRRILPWERRGIPLPLESTTGEERKPDLGHDPWIHQLWEDASLRRAYEVVPLCSQGHPFVTERGEGEESERFEGEREAPP